MNKELKDFKPWMGTFNPDVIDYLNVKGYQFKNKSEVYNMDDKEKYGRLKNAISVRLRQLRESLDTHNDPDIFKLTKGGIITLQGIQEVIHQLDK